MTKKKTFWTPNRRGIAVACGVGLASEVVPYLGIIPTGIVFPAGIHSESPMGFIALVFIFNFILVAGIAFIPLKTFPGGPFN